MSEEGKKQKKIIDWEGVELHYRAGIRSLKDIGSEYGVSDAGIIKKARALGWVRDLSAKIKAKADARVSAAAVSEEVSIARAANEQAVVEANAELQYRIRMEHRTDIGKTRGLFKKLLAEVESATDEKDSLKAFLTKAAYMVDRALEDVTDKLDISETRGLLKDIRDDVHKLTSLSNRIEQTKKLTEVLEKLVRLEREAFGISNEEGGGGSSIDDLLSKVHGVA